MTSLDGINGWSIQTLLRGDNDSKQSDEFQAITKQVFFKYSEENSVFGKISSSNIIEFEWEVVGWDGHLFDAGCLLTFSSFRMGAYSWWALIRGLAPI